MGPVPFFVGPVPLFSRGLVTQEGVSVHPSVCPSVRMYVRPSPVFFQHFASGFGISAPAQLHVTNADRVYGSPNAPAHRITAPAQPPRLMPGRVSGLVFFASCPLLTAFSGMSLPSAIPFNLFFYQPFLLLSSFL